MSKAAFFAVAALFSSSLLAADPAPVSAPPPAAGTPLEQNVVNVGDRLRYQVEEDGDPAVDLVVSNTGMVELPYFGPIAAAGKTLSALTADITAALQKDLYIVASVRLSVLEYRTRAVNRGRVHLSGQVRRIGPVDLDMSERNTLGRVILAAGGLADFADERNVRVVRKDAQGIFQTLTVDLREVFDKGRIEKDLELQDGDFIIVDQRMIKW